MRIIDFNTMPLSGIGICIRCRFCATCNKNYKNYYDIFNPKGCDEYLAMYNIIEQKIDTGEIFYDHYKNKYGKEFRERD